MSTALIGHAGERRRLDGEGIGLRAGGGFQREELAALEYGPGAIAARHRDGDLIGAESEADTALPGGSLVK